MSSRMQGVLLRSCPIQRARGDRCERVMEIMCEREDAIRLIEAAKAVYPEVAHEIAQYLGLSGME